MIHFFDSSRKIEVMQIEGNLCDAPLVGDSVILKSSEEYKKIYGYSDKTASITFRLIDYRDNSITLYID